METVEKIEELQLIKGEFSHTDAKQVVLDLIERKIKFHVLRNFSSNERYNEDHSESVEKIIQLRLYKEEVIEYFNNRAGTNAEYYVESLLTIIPKID